MIKLKDVVELPEKKYEGLNLEGDPTHHEYIRNELIDEIGNIPIDEAFKKWAEKNGYVSKAEFQEVKRKWLQAYECAENYQKKYEELRDKMKGYIKLSDVELGVEKIADIIDKRYIQADKNWGMNDKMRDTLAKAIAKAKPIKVKGEK